MATSHTITPLCIKEMHNEPCSPQSLILFEKYEPRSDAASFGQKGIKVSPLYDCIFLMRVNFHLFGTCLSLCSKTKVKNVSEIKSMRKKQSLMLMHALQISDGGKASHFRLLFKGCNEYLNMHRTDRLTYKESE